MTKNPTAEKCMPLEKLPVWARNYIHELETERDIAVNALNKHLDSATKSHAYYENLISTGEGTDNQPGQGPTLKRFYIQSNRITFECAGVALDVICHPEGSTMHNPGIEIRWGDGQGAGSMVALACQQHTVETMAITADDFASINQK